MITFKQFQPWYSFCCFMLAGKVFSLKQRFLLQTAGISNGSTNSQTSLFSAAVALQGYLMTLRNLAHKFARVPSAPLQYTSSKGGSGMFNETAQLKQYSRIPFHSNRFPNSLICCPNEGTRRKEIVKKTSSSSRRTVRGRSSGRVERTQHK